LTRDEWIADFAGRVGTEPPTPKEVEELLDLAAIAAHASERTAAPLACWIAGRAGGSFDELREAALQVEAG
jgi:Domain of unknown function (DUF6457)